MPTGLAFPFKQPLNNILRRHPSEGDICKCTTEPQVGFEPTRFRLQGDCSGQTELQRQISADHTNTVTLRRVPHRPVIVGISIDLVPPVPLDTVMMPVPFLDLVPGEVDSLIESPEQPDIDVDVTILDDDEVNLHETMTGVEPVMRQLCRPRQHHATSPLYREKDSNPRAAACKAAALPLSYLGKVTRRRIELRLTG